MVIRFENFTIARVRRTPARFRFVARGAFQLFFFFAAFGPTKNPAAATKEGQAAEVAATPRPKKKPKYIRQLPSLRRPSCPLSSPALPSCLPLIQRKQEARKKGGTKLKKKKKGRTLPLHPPGHTQTEKTTGTRRSTRKNQTESTRTGGEERPQRRGKITQQAQKGTRFAPRCASRVGAKKKKSKESREMKTSESHDLTRVESAPRLSGTSFACAARPDRRRAFPRSWEDHDFFLSFFLLSSFRLRPQKPFAPLCATGTPPHTHRHAKSATDTQKPARKAGSNRSLHVFSRTAQQQEQKSYIETGTLTHRERQTEREQKHYPPETANTTNMTQKKKQSTWRWAGRA